MNPLMNALMPGEHNYQQGKPMPGQMPMQQPQPMMQPEQSEIAKRGGFLGGVGNALGAVLKFGAPEAYEQGRQMKARDSVGNALAEGNYESAAQTALRAGNVDQGLAIRGAGTEQQAVQRKQEAQGVLQLFTTLQPAQVTQYAMEDPAGFERMTGMSSDEYMQAGAKMQQMGIGPDQFAQMVISKAQAELGQAPTPEEAYTLAPGARRFKGEQEIAANPVMEKTPGYEQVTLADGEYEYIPGQPETMRKLGNSPTKGPLVQVNTGDMPSKDTLSPFQLKQDEIYAQTPSDWNTGGASDAAKGITQMKAVSERLRSGEDLTGFLLGMTPDFVARGINPKAVDTRELAEEVVQRNLRIILGAQFTAKEGERLIARAYNKGLSEEMNAERIDRLVQAMDGRAQQVKSLNDYVTRYGTSAGWDGSLATVDDLLDAMDGQGGGRNAPAKGQESTRFPSQVNDPEVDALMNMYGDN